MEEDISLGLLTMVDKSPIVVVLSFVCSDTNYCSDHTILETNVYKKSFLINLGKSLKT